MSGKPRSSHPVYLHPSGYRDCGLSPRIGPARSGALLNGRVVFQLCRRASHSPFLSYCFRKLPVSRRTERMGGERDILRDNVPISRDVPPLFSFAARHKSLGGLVPLFKEVLSLSLSFSFRVRPGGQSSTLMRYRGA